MKTTWVNLFMVCGVSMLATSRVEAGGGTPAFSDQTFGSGVIATQNPLGLHSFLAGGAVGDFNNDGWQDIFFAGGGGTADKLFINNGNGTFTDQAAAWGVAATHRSTAATVGDFNNDGWLDIYVTSHGPVAGAAVGHHRLYRNNGNGTFTNVATTAGVNQASTIAPDGWGAAWGDYDLDGDLDLAVAGWQSNGNRLFRNNGNNTFTDVTTTAGLTSVISIDGFAPRFADMNGDRFPELIWIGDFSTSQYYVNNGNGTFTDFTAGSGTSLDGTEMGMTVADFDLDGLFDFYVTTIVTNNLYINQGNHTYVNRANTAGVSNTGWGWGTVAIDFDHDSRVDLVATDQNGAQWAYRNTTPEGGSPSFGDVSAASGLISNVSGRGLANLDYDNDGDQDIVIFPRSAPVKVFRNDLSGPNTHWVRVFLDNGTMENIPPQGIGSVVKVTVGAQTLMGRIDGGSNYLSQSEMSAHFGLGSATVIDELRVEWTNGDVTTMANVPADQTLTIVAAAPSTLGDMDCSGSIDHDDVKSFALALANPDLYELSGCDILRGDFDENEQVDGRDIPGFIAFMLGP
ncbi:MAG: CRTAC1 family protein [Phycisphaerales bacterium]|nr:CRTAC1 family protein [Phycisphaerales bacterium]